MIEFNASSLTNHIWKCSKCGEDNRPATILHHEDIDALVARCHRCKAMIFEMKPLKPYA